MGGEHPQAQQLEHASEERASHIQRTSSRRSKSEHKGFRKSVDEKRVEKKSSSLRWRRSRNDGLADLHRLSTMHLNGNLASPPAYGDVSDSALAVPVPPFAQPRFSESSQSEGSNASSGDGPIYGSTTTTTHTVSTHTTFFKLPGRNKNRNSLFPLPVKVTPRLHEDQTATSPDGPATPRQPDAALPTRSYTPDPQSPPATALQTATLRRRYTETSPTKRRTRQHPPVPSPQAALAKGALSFAEPGMNLFRNGSTRSQSSSRSSPLQPPLRVRDRASTTSSFGRHSDMETPPPPPSASGRNSTSTTGRSSFGTLLHLSRFRQGSEPYSPRHGSPGTNSKSNSFALSREALVVPEREEGDTPGKYLERLEAAVSRSLIAGILSKSADPFAQAVLRSYTRRFPFFTEPVDMSLRKFLLEAELPKETQQVDRVIQAFADRYHECNPGIFTAPDQAYIIAFSIMMLHTDAFNKNNKRKMQKHDYIKNTSGQGISDDVLACFYDNICYTPFVHYEEEVDINGERVLPFKPKKSTGKLKSAIPGADVGKRPSGPVDPYNLLVDQKLDQLRPSIKDSITMDDPYNYRGGHGELDIHYLQRAFTHTGILQIISARSRPAAYESQEGNDNPDPTDTQQGIVDLKITKVGTIWRKAAKRKKARSPWQEWGAILTGSQLYLFKNAHWAKGLLHQFTSQQKPGVPRIPVVFKPPLEDFKPDALIKTDNAVALIDATYTRHKHAFTFVRPGGQEEVLLADSESELNDWLGLINYAAAFRAAGVRIRGMLGGNEEDLRRQELRRLNSVNSSHSIQTKMGEITVQNRGLSPQLQRQVLAARRQIMLQKIGEIEREFIDANRQLDGMLRNARHLLILAPISQRSREDVIHAAAKGDAMIKWLRRDIWRMKCHRDILAMDVRIDGISANELERMAFEQVERQSEPESLKKEKRGMLSRLQSSKAPRSPLQSPITDRTPMNSPGDGFFGGDVFRTPPESSTQQQGSEPWRLPPLSLNPSEQAQHRPSITSTLLSASPSHGAHSMSYASSASSVLHVERTESIGQSDVVSADGGRITPVPTMEEKELQMLARTTITPEPDTRGLTADGAPQTVTPDSKPRGVRRSLQKTLREAHHHHHGHPHRHRRGKDSDSTVRSAIATEDREIEDGTPGLARDKPRFILHGKQASVVQFGGDWERMKLRREQYAKDSTGSPDQYDSSATSINFPASRYERSGGVSPIIQDFRRPGTGKTSLDDDDDEAFDTASFTSAGSRSFRDDAVAAAVYSADAVGPHSSHSLLRKSSVSGGSESQPFPAVDTADFPPTSHARKRETVIGPATATPGAATAEWVQQHHGLQSGLQKGEDGTVRLVDATDDEDVPYNGSPLSPRNADRDTVLGPGNGPVSAGAEYKDSHANAAHGAGDEEGNEGEDEMDASHETIEEEELKRLSTVPKIPGAW